VDFSLHPLNPLASRGEEGEAKNIVPLLPPGGGARGGGKNSHLFLSNLCTCFKILKDIDKFIKKYIITISWSLKSWEQTKNP